MKRFEDGFIAQLKGLNFDTLENTADSVYGLTPSLKLCYFNPAWLVFASENDGEPEISERFQIGVSISEAISSTLKHFYLGMFSHVLDTGQVIQHDYECSSPDVFRLYHQSIYPLHDQGGLVIVNSLAKEHPHGPGIQAAWAELQEQYTQPNGLILQCSHCRRTQRRDAIETWDWVPVFVEQQPSNTSHGLCPVCFDYYYGFVLSYRGLKERVEQAKAC